MTKKTRKSDDLQPVSTELEPDARPEAKIEDPIGDETDGEAAVAIEPAIESRTEAGPASEDSEPEFNARPPVQLERLQKILAKAGVASRRKAEEMIEQGRVQVNGKVVTVLGTKADAARDHIRVDGKLLQGAERHRYFVLNKPRGFVTTVKDPEGRPTVMQFFSKMHERLYPVGRLDYMSEGLLVVTNDGELANRLTRAAAGVEKTYLVKVSGQPTEAELNLLRGGVAIERGSPGPPQTGLRLRGGGKPGSGQVRTSPARIRQVRQGDNPWYEVVLIEGRNRELRKMFEEIGHFVEKIRRVGYGPLVLDQEPGNLRELEPEELAALRKAAEGKLRTPKSKELRRRPPRRTADAQLPTLAPRPTRPQPAKPFAARRFEDRSSAARPSDYRPKKSFGADSPSHPSAKDFGSARPKWKKNDRPYPGKPYGEKPSADRVFPAKPAWKKPESRKWAPSKRSPVDRSARPRRDADEIVDLGRKTPSRLHIEPILQSDRPSPNRPSAPRPRPDRPFSDRSGPDHYSAGHSGAGRSSSARPFRGEGGLARPFTTSSGKPRAGGARPSSKPGKPATNRSYGAGSSRGPKPYPNSAPRAERKAGPGWKPKTRYGGSGKPASGGSSKPGAPADRRVPSGWSVGWKPGAPADRRVPSGWSVGWKPGGFSKSAYKGKPSGPRRTGAPGGKKRS
ncbi:MAG: pseudouridine synthase [Terracidiphilus sp.]|jgi:23S rRNA pseudouridine2605 synthase